MVLSNDVAALVGFACEAVLWGVYVVLFLASVILLLRRLWTRSLSIPIFIANCVLFASCTAHFALEFNHFYITLGSTGVKHFANETEPLIAADILISLSDLLGGLVLLYRCWVIWGKNYYVILLPLLTAITGFVCIMAVAHLIVTMSPTTPVPPAALVPLGIAGYALPLATNFMATALIVAKLWLSTRGAGKRASVRVTGTMRAAQRAVAIIVESGLLYLATQVVFVVLFALKHPAQAILAVVAVQIYGIAPTLIVIRVALGISSDFTHRRGHDNASVTELGSMSDDVHPPRSAFLPGMQSVGSSTEESGRTLKPESVDDGEHFEMKTVSSGFGGHAIAV